MTFLATVWSWQTAFVIVGAAGLMIVAVLLSQMHLLDDRQGEEPALAKAPAGLGLRAIVSPPVMFMFLFLLRRCHGGDGHERLHAGGPQDPVRHEPGRCQPDPDRLPGGHGGRRVVRRIRGGPDATAGPGRRHRIRRRRGCAGAGGANLDALPGGPHGLPVRRFHDRHDFAVAGHDGAQHFAARAPVVGSSASSALASTWAG